jgi:hypothetical protein
VTSAGKKSRNWLWFLVLPAGFFLMGYSGALEYLGKQATVFFKLYAEAELQKLNATSNVNIKGEHEFVVALENVNNNQTGSEFLGTFAGVTEIRDTDFSNWYVIAVDASVSDAVGQIRDASAVKFMFANRGVWICH